jgi:hypothetical protein
MVRSRAAWLGVLGLVTLGGLVYLFLQVTADPAPSAAATGSVAAVDQKPSRGGKTTEGAQPEPGGSGRSAVVPVPPRVKTVKDATAKITDDSRVAPALAEDSPGETSPDVNLDAAMDEANKFYDHSDYEAASKQALRVLEKHPDNVRMLRIVVSSACMMGDADMATKYFATLPARDQGDMAKRCARYEIPLTPTKQPLPVGGSGTLRVREAGPASAPKTN